MEIPKYLAEIISLKLLQLAPVSEQAENMPVYGYTYRLYRYTNGQYESSHSRAAEKICKWAKRQYADAYTTRLVSWSEKEHRKPYYKRDYWLLVITDPVSYRLEKLIKEANS